MLSNGELKDLLKNLSAKTRRSQPPLEEQRLWNPPNPKPHELENPTT